MARAREHAGLRREDRGEAEAEDGQGLEEQADPHHAACSDAVGELGCDPGAQEGADGEGEDDEPSFQCCVSERALQEQGQGEQHAELAEGHDEGGDGAVPEAPDREQPQVDERWLSGLGA